MLESIVASNLENRITPIRIHCPPVPMRRGTLYRISITFILSVAVLLFYLVNVQVSNYENKEYRRILIRGTQDRQLLIINKNDIDELAQSVYEQDHLIFESEIDIDKNEGDAIDEEDTLLVERFESRSRHLSVNSDSEQEQEFYYDNSIPDGEPKAKREARFTEPSLTPVISRDALIPKEDVVHLCVVVCEDRADEALTMLKSVAMVTENASIVFHIIADVPRQKIIQTRLEQWPKEYSLHISYYIYNVTYFEGTAWNAWKSLYKPCAVQRLFLSDRLLNVDSLIYVDTDTIFLHSVVDLWNQFQRFNSTQLISLVQESEDGKAGWYNRFASHPYFGEYGVNSGVMLMNLTRLRRTNWLSEMQSIYQNYRLAITWGDQDLINIYFSEHPEQLFIMPCEWNYRTDHCMYVSNCKTAQQKGVSLLHGSRGSFYQNKEPTFNAVHQAFEHYILGESLTHQFLPDLHQRLRHASPSNCGKVQSLFLTHLSRLAQSSEHVANAKILSQKALEGYRPPDNVMSDGKSIASGTEISFSNKMHMGSDSILLRKLGLKSNLPNLVNANRLNNGGNALSIAAGVKSLLKKSPYIDVKLDDRNIRNLKPNLADTKSGPR